MQYLKDLAWGSTQLEAAEMKTRPPGSNRPQPKRQAKVSEVPLRTESTTTLWTGTRTESIFWITKIATCTISIKFKHCIRPPRTAPLKIRIQLDSRVLTRSKDVSRQYAECKRIKQWRIETRWDWMRCSQWCTTCPPFPPVKTGNLRQDKRIIKTTSLRSTSLVVFSKSSIQVKTSS